MASKIALVTISTFAVAAETAEQLARAGAAAVVLNGRSEATGQALVARPPAG